MVSNAGRSTNAGESDPAPAHSSPSQGEEGLWPRWGLKQAAVLCAPSWGSGARALSWERPLLLEEEQTWPQRALPGASVLC